MCTMAFADLFSLKYFELAYVITLCFVVYSIAVGSTYTYVACVAILYICLKIIRQKSTGRIEVKGQGIFITGCDTGFGHDLARRLDELGFTVFAGCLHPEGKGATKLESSSSENVHIVPLDVSKDESLQSAHDYVVKNMPETGFWGIVSNAGFNVMGDVELCTLNLYHKAMNVNYYGAIRTIRQFLYLVRESKGRVVVMSSVKGRSSWPANSAYHVTKHGLETMSDSLRLEMVKFGVQVSIIEPGAFDAATECQSEEVFKRYEEEADEMWENASEDVRNTYGKEYVTGTVKNQKEKIKNLTSANTTKPVIDAMEDALTSERPHTRYMIDGGSGWIDPQTTIARYYDLMPTWLSDWIVVKLTKCDKFPDDAKKKHD